MSALHMSNRPELALMALAIRKCHEVFERKPNGGYLGRTALQKIMYFLVRRGVPLPYRFEIYNYGPFCSDIYYDVECLEADHVVVNRAKNAGGRYWNYAPGDNIEDLLQEHYELLARYNGVVDEVAIIFADLSPQALELIATLDYLYQDERAKQGRSPDKTSVVDRFEQVKGEKYTRTVVEEMYDALLRAQIFAES